MDEDGNEISFEDASDEMDDDGEDMDDRIEEGLKNVSSDEGEDDDGWEDMADEDQGMAVDEGKKKGAAKGSGDATKAEVAEKKKKSSGRNNNNAPWPALLFFLRQQ